MRKLHVFNHMSLDGFIADQNSSMDWAHAGAEDKDWQKFLAGNVAGDSVLMFGRVTYDMMAGFWPSAAAKKNMPDVAKKMNDGEKIVFSTTMQKPDWKNTRLFHGDLVSHVRTFKNQRGPDIVILGSANLISQLSAAKLIDFYQIALNPIVLGGGKSMFAGLDAPLNLKLKKSKAFKNGKVVLNYELA